MGCYNSRREVITTIEFVSLSLGLLSVAVSWRFGTKNKRLKKKILEHEESLSKIETYTSITGYKTMLHDCFHIFSYVYGAVLLSIGVKSAIFSIVTNMSILRFFEQFIAGIYIGSGMVLLKLFVLLSRASKPDIATKNLQSKIDKLKAET